MSSHAENLQPSHSLSDQSQAERARFVVEHSSDVISVHRPYDWVYVEVNPAILDLMGYAPEEVLGVSALDYFHPDDAHAFRTNTAKILYNKGVYTKQYRLRHKDGHFIWVESTHRSIRDSEGALVEIICVSRDMTLRVSAEAENERLAAIVQASSDMIVFFDQSFALNFVNQSARASFGAELGLRLSSVLSQPVFENFLKVIWPNLGTGKHWRGEFLFPFGSAGERTAAIEEGLVFSQEDGGRCYVLIAREHTKQILAEAVVRDQRAAMVSQARLLSVGEMASVLAHEVNQPLGAIANYAHGALRRIEAGQLADAASIRPVLEKIGKQADRAGGIIRGIRSIVRRSPDQKTSFDINRMCSEVIAYLDQDVVRLGAVIDFQPDREAGLLVANRVQIEQVLINLLQNAIAAINEAEPAQKHICVTTRRLDNQLLLTVTDKGVGIANEDLEAVFSSYMTTRATGLGLGLSISRSIIESHGGAIWAEPDLSCGACFRVRLPMGGQVS